MLLAAVSFPPLMVPLFSVGFSTIHLTDVGGGLALNTKLAVASWLQLDQSLTCQLQ